MNSKLVLGTFSMFILALSACTADGTASEDNTAAADTAEDTAADTTTNTAQAEEATAKAGGKENVGEAQSALFSGYWTGLTSEEDPPISCASGFVVDAIKTTGSNSDNVGLHCGSIGRSATYQNWSALFSEEGTNWKLCTANQFMVGIACTGSYCDNISIQCASFANTTRSSNCYWTPWFSEEQGSQYVMSGYAAAGLQCRGSYCDDMSIYAGPVELN